jgi:hypothetical protein
MSSPRYYSTVSVTRPADTTAYTELDVLGATSASVLEFANIAPVGGGPIVLLYASLTVSIGTLPAGLGQTRIHLYSSAPTAIADNAAFNLPSGDRSLYLGYITLGAPADLGDTLFVEDDFLRKTIVATSSSVFAITQTLGAFTPSASTVKTWELVAAELE